MSPVRLKFAEIMNRTQKGLNLFKQFAPLSDNVSRDLIPFYLILYRNLSFFIGRMAFCSIYPRTFTVGFFSFLAFVSHYHFINFICTQPVCLFSYRILLLKL